VPCCRPQYRYGWEALGFHVSTRTCVYTKKVITVEYALLTSTPGSNFSSCTVLSRGTHKPALARLGSSLLSVASHLSLT
jgi:hypothetical protein